MLIASLSNTATKYLTNVFSSFWLKWKTMLDLKTPKSIYPNGGVNVKLGVIELIIIGIKYIPLVNRRPEIRSITNDSTRAKKPLSNSYLRVLILKNKTASRWKRTNYAHKQQQTWSRIWIRLLYDGNFLVELQTAFYYTHYIQIHRVATVFKTILLILKRFPGHLMLHPLLMCIRCWNSCKGDQ